MSRTFKTVRDVDVSGVSGTGVVTEGVQFSDGTVVIRWLGELRSTAVYNNIEEFEEIHGHGGNTRVEWDDEHFVEVKGWNGPRGNPIFERIADVNVPE